jgi:hypothetical protein
MLVLSWVYAGVFIAVRENQHSMLVNVQLFSHLHNLDQVILNVADKGNPDTVVGVIPDGIHKLASCVYGALHEGGNIVRLEALDHALAISGFGVHKFQQNKHRGTFAGGVKHNFGNGPARYFGIHSDQFCQTTDRSIKCGAFFQIVNKQFGETKM